MHWLECKDLHNYTYKQQNFVAHITSTNIISITHGTSYKLSRARSKQESNNSSATAHGVQYSITHQTYRSEYSPSRCCHAWALTGPLCFALHSATSCQEMHQDLPKTCTALPCCALLSPTMP